MSHYDCKDCGATMGIGYGLCSSCTPPEVITLKEELKDEINTVEMIYDELNWSSYVSERDKFVEERVGELRKKYQTLYDKHKQK